MKFSLSNAFSSRSVLGNNSPVKKPDRTVSNSSSTVASNSSEAKRTEKPQLEPSNDVKAVEALVGQFQANGFKGVDTFVSAFESPEAVFTLDDHPDIPCGSLAAIL